MLTINRKEKANILPNYFARLFTYETETLTQAMGQVQHTFK